VTTPVAFGDAPIPREISDATANTVEGAYTNATVTVRDNLDWLLTIAVSNADKPDVQFGMQTGATDGYDEGTFDLDSPEAPAPGVPQGGVYFVDADDFLYRRDVRAPAEAATTWNLEVVANQLPMTLSWNPAAIPSDWHFTMHEVNAGNATIPGTLIDMATTTTREVAALTVKYYVITASPDAPCAATAEIEFAAGWNLISLPIEPCNRAVDAVLWTQDRDGEEEAAGAMRDGRRGTIYTGAVWRFVNDGVNEGHYEQVTELHALVGYWVYAPAAVTVTVTGTAPAGRESLALNKGWNLVGPAEDVGTPQNADLQGHAWWWDTAAGAYAALDPAGVGAFKAGKGFWLFAKRAFSLDLGR